MKDEAAPRTVSAGDLASVPVQNGVSERVVMRDAAGQWLQFRDPCQIIATSCQEEVVDCLRQVESLVDVQGLHAAGFVSYEAAPAFDRALPVREMGTFPLLWFGLYGRAESIELPLTSAQTSDSGPWLASVSQVEYEKAIARIKAYIADGGTYQVNYTFRFRKPFLDDPWRLFLDLVEAQQPRYAAFIDTREFAVCSASPELFFRLDGESLMARPMKGTVARGPSCEADSVRRQWLEQSEKNRAENAMIVDMMRNDLGKIAEVGSVQVCDLFRVERYPTLWQMTSTVAARTKASVCEIVGALFPCASITGAPKPNTMRIIAELEATPRQIYTGCIGTISPGRRAQFNVAIRTVLVDKIGHEAEYGVGGGVVWDSTADGEYQECLLKAQILTQRRPQFSLLESLLWTPAEGFFLLEEHLGRMGASADYFGFVFDADRIRDRLAKLAGSLPPVAHKVRLLVSQLGESSCEASPIEEPRDAPVRLKIASQPVDSADPFLWHKTTHRDVYEAALADCVDADDVVLYNQRGEVTETSIANLVVRIGQEWLTPSIECGLLAGTFRAKLLAEGKIRERRLTLEMLARSEEVFVINSVRKWRRAQILSPWPAR